MTDLKYKKVFTACPQVGDSDFGAKWGEIRITIEASHHTMPDDELPEMIETLNEMFDADFKTEEDVKKEEEHWTNYIADNTQPIKQD